MGKTRIEWTDATWNPVVGCSKISDGCNNCYAEKMAARLKAMKVNGYQHVIGVCGPHWTGETAFVESVIKKPFKWKKPCRIFVCSMGDLFHESVKDEWLHRAFNTMVINERHIFMLLTKRPQRMKDYLLGEIPWIKTAGRPKSGLLNHIWLGVTCENQRTTDERIPVLLQIPAAVRFVSVEPMLEYVDIGQYLPQYDYRTTYDYFQAYQKMKGESPTGKPDLIKPGIDWVICGGETGPGARPMRAGWAIALRDQCKSEGVPFFFKKYGTWWCKKQGISPKNIENRQLGGELIEEYPQAGTEVECKPYDQLVSELQELKTKMQNDELFMVRIKNDPQKNEEYFATTFVDTRFEVLVGGQWQIYDIDNIEILHKST